ncbi:MAG TPA: DUF4269 domain-containing protein, partial [Methyloceanibacter sp.]|nr:DUF4269 domain-containing protein [Methyloceanibacter sp.]
MRPEYRVAVLRSGILTALAEFDPHVAGTPPLGLDTATSDVDVLCHAPDGVAFAKTLVDAF